MSATVLGIGLGGDTGDAQRITIARTNQFVLLQAYAGGMLLWDVTDPTSPVLLSTTVIAGLLFLQMMTDSNLAGTNAAVTAWDYDNFPTGPFIPSATNTNSESITPGTNQVAFRNSLGASPQVLFCGDGTNIALIDAESIGASFPKHYSVTPVLALAYTASGIALNPNDNTVFYTTGGNTWEKWTWADLGPGYGFTNGYTITLAGSVAGYIHSDFTSERDERSTLNSTFIITVKAHANGLSTPIGKTTVNLPNMYKANLNNGKIVPKVVPARVVAQAGGGYTAKLEVNNLEDVALDLSSAIVMPIACDGTDKGGKIVEAASIFSKPRLPAGKSSLDITIPASATTSDTCRIRYEATGKTADGRPVVLVAAVFVRDPPVGRVDTATSEYRARVKVVEAAMRALGRVDKQGNLSGTINDAEIYELQLKGLLGEPVQQPVELPTGCGSCRPDQICGIVSYHVVISSPGSGTYAVKGDVAFLHNDSGEITPIIKALGESWTHTGIMVDGNHCRSDLMGGQAGTPLKDLVDAPVPSALESFGGQLLCNVGDPSEGDIKIHPADLYQGTPGVITQAMYNSSYFYPYGVTLAQPAGLASATYSPRWTMRAAADTANGISQRYGIYGYTDWAYAANQPGTYELSPKGIPSGHEGCSGFVMRALYNTAKTLPNFVLNTYSAAIRQKAANAMHTGLYGNCTDSGISGYIYESLLLRQCSFPACSKGQLTFCQINKLQDSCNGNGKGIAQWTEGLLNQVINCFAFGDRPNGEEYCSATNSIAWQNPGAGSGTISPDSVYNQMGTKYSATYQQEVLYPTVWTTVGVLGCIDTHITPERKRKVRPYSARRSR